MALKKCLRTALRLIHRICTHQDFRKQRKLCEMRTLFTFFGHLNACLRGINKINFIFYDDDVLRRCFDVENLRRYDALSRIDEKDLLAHISILFYVSN